MTLSPELRERIESLIRSDRVVLFMKGTRQGPQCGFSAQVVQILDRLVPEYTTVDVLAEPEIREAVKLFSEWPTVPQLYVEGEFVGGCDIVRELFASGEIFEALRVPAPSGAAPRVKLTDTAAEELRRLGAGTEGRELHLTIDASLQPALYFGPAEEGEIRVVANGVTLAMDPLSASRAEGARVDARATAEGPAFQVDVAGAAQVRQQSAREVKARIDRGEKLQFVDVRTPEERERARIEGTRLLDDALVAELESLDRDTPLVFHCHHGGRSQRAAEHFAALGFRDVTNLAGGIDAWSQEIDAAVPRY